jgi:DMSO/TMAO reductase YedYZ molybdopterin-dependent catalytic subunit
MTESDDRERILAARKLRRERVLSRESAQPREPAGAPGQLRPLGSGPPNRHGMPKLPVGQTPTAPGKWPVLDLGAQPSVSLAEWRLELFGACARAQTLDWAAFQALEQSTT